MGHSPWGRYKSDTTEQLHFHFSLSCIGEGNGNPLQCSCLENPRDGGAWWAAVSGVAQSQTRLKWLSSSSSNGTGCHDLSFLKMLGFKLAFSLSSFTLIKRLFSSSSLSAFRVVSSAYQRLLIFSPAILISIPSKLGIHPDWHFTWSTHVKLRVSIYNLVVLRSQFWTSPLFHVWF